LYTRKKNKGLRGKRKTDFSHVPLNVANSIVNWNSRINSCCWDDGLDKGVTGKSPNVTTKSETNGLQKTSADIKVQSVRSSNFSLQTQRKIRSIWYQKKKSDHKSEVISRIAETHSTTIRVLPLEYYFIWTQMSYAHFGDRIFLQSKKRTFLRWIWFLEIAIVEKKQKGSTNVDSTTNVNTLSSLRCLRCRAPIESPSLLRFSLRKDEITYIHKMKNDEGLFLRTPKDILPLNAYFKLNQKIRRCARRHIC